MPWSTVSTPNVVITPGLDLHITWPDGTTKSVANVAADQSVVVSYNDVSSSLS